jgi:hypothetical protein
MVCLGLLDIHAPGKVDHLLLRQVTPLGWSKMFFCLDSRHISPHQRHKVAVYLSVPMPSSLRKTIVRIYMIHPITSIAKNRIGTLHHNEDIHMSVHEHACPEVFSCGWGPTRHLREHLCGASIRVKLSLIYLARKPWSLNRSLPFESNCFRLLCWPG